MSTAHVARGNGSRPVELHLRALAAKVTRSTGTHRAPALGETICVDDRPVRARTSGDFGRQSARLRRIPLVRSPPRHGEAHARGHGARAAPARGSKPSATVPQSPPARLRARLATRRVEMPA